MANQKVDSGQVIQRYQELRNLRCTGDEFGITRERVRQLVNRAGISTARIPKPKPLKPDRLCKQCGALVSWSRARYCEAHRTPQEKARRRYHRLKANPEKYAHWRELIKQYDERRRERIRELKREQR